MGLSRFAFRMSRRISLTCCALSPSWGAYLLPTKCRNSRKRWSSASLFWKRHFNGDAAVLGKSFTNHNTGIATTVVGVMPSGFAPFYGERIDLWQPINPASSRYEARQDHWLMPVAAQAGGAPYAGANRNGPHRPPSRASVSCDKQRHRQKGSAF